MAATTPTQNAVTPGQGMVNSPFAKLAPELRLQVYEDTMGQNKKHPYHKTPPLLQVCSLIRKEARPLFLNRVNSVHVAVSLETNPAKASQFCLSEHEKARLSAIPSNLISKLERIDVIVRCDTNNYNPFYESPFYGSPSDCARLAIKSIEFSVHSDGRCQFAVFGVDSQDRYYSPKYSYRSDDHHGVVLCWVAHDAFYHCDWT
ncbi:hypothetical protein MBLNU457_2007t1 [Dothideomycetes sp. NU457]